MVDGATSGRDAAHGEAERDTDDSRRHERSRHRVRIPGFATSDDAELGLGDALARVTTAMGVRPCGGCGRRAEALNRWMAIGGGREH